MEQTEVQTDIPLSLLTSLEDLTAELVGIQELVLAVAATAQYLPECLPANTSEQIH